MYLTRTRPIKNIGFVSTRFDGTDGVSLETWKWATVLKRMGYECFFFSGMSELPQSHSMVVDEAFFGHPEVAALQDRCFGLTVRDEKLTGEIHRLRQKLKKKLYEFIKRFSVDMLIVENAVAIPMHIPFGLAITELIAETGIPTVGHHHDFVWERQRFLVSAADDYIAMAFPPRLHSINHIVINTEARRQLGYRCGLSSIVIPNVFDFSEPVPSVDDYNATFREDLGIGANDVLLLQPTRVVARKGIEHAVELASRLRDRPVKLLVSHQERDEGSDYFRRIEEYARFLEVDLLIATDRIASSRGSTRDGHKVYSLWDCYVHCDFVTYPSLYEGFGNAFLEAIYFRKPILVNRYSIYQSDIEPIGFQTVLMDSYITDDTVRHVRRLLDDADFRRAATERNFELGARYFSYELLEQRLKSVIMNFGVVG